MSILIKGMEMPSNCAECPLNHDAECAVKNCMVIDDCYVRRAFWCPLIPVPPHGRLIDAEAFIKDECNNCDGACELIPCNCLNCTADCRCDFIKDMADAPTIIPASEEGEA